MTHSRPSAELSSSQDCGRYSGEDSQVGETERGLSAVEFTGHPSDKAVAACPNLPERVDSVSRDV